MKNHILIITPYYYPDIAANVGLIKDLAEYLSQYFEVSVLTNQTREQDYSKNREKPNSSLLIMRKYNPFIHKNGLLSKIFEYLFFMLQAYLYVKNRHQRFPVIFCQSTPPLMSIPIRYAVGKRSKIIYNVQDLFPDSLIPYFGDRRYSILHKVEIASYKAADSISTICYEFYKKIQLRSHKASKIIHNWVDCNEIHYIDKENNTIYTIFDELDWNKKNIVYSGNIGINQDFEPIIAIARDFDDCNFVIIGKGKRKIELQKKVKELRLNNVYFFDPLPRERISEIYSFADVYLLPMKKNAMKASYPSKTWSILACGSVLVASVDVNSSFAKELTGNELAFVCAPGDKQQLSKAIRMALLENRKNAEKRIEYVRKNYDKNNILSQYKQLFDEQLVKERYD